MQRLTHSKFSVLNVAQTVGRPVRQFSQCPQWAKDRTTGSPTANLVTPGPTFSTTPEHAPSKVDADMCTALVEPGVTYQQLYDYIQGNNLPLMLSFPAPSAIAGPVGNTMERGVGLDPLW